MKFPMGRQATANMKAAHIIPMSLNTFDEKINTEFSDTARTRDMLQSRTSMDLDKLAGPRINAPVNTIYMTTNEQSSFGRFHFYLEKDAYPEAPNKYKVHILRCITLTTGSRSADIEFRTAPDSSIARPGTELIRIHADFAKVLHLSGAAKYVEELERDIDRNKGLYLEKKIDLPTLLLFKLALVMFS